MFKGPEGDLVVKVIGDSREEDKHFIKVGAVGRAGIVVDGFRMLLSGGRAILDRATELAERGLVDVEVNKSDVDMEAMFKAYETEPEFIDSPEDFAEFKEQYKKNAEEEGAKICLVVKVSDLEIISGGHDVPAVGTVMTYTRLLSGFDDEGNPTEITDEELVAQYEEELLGKKVEIVGHYLGFPGLSQSPIVFAKVLEGPREGSHIHPILAELEEIK